MGERDVSDPPGQLKRELGPAAMVVYGVGGMLGGGIYAMVGEVAGRAGDLAWVCFAVAVAVAAPTAMSYAELASRHPRSGGESWYAHVAFERDWIALVVGWMVLFSGIVSMAALADAFAGYLRELVGGAPSWLVVIAFLGGLGVINARGIRLASTANVVCTLVEVGGLVLVIVAGAAFVFGGGEPAASAAPEPAGEGTSWLAVLQGGALAFYAFIGFEDMVNVAEEVRRPRRDLPLAIGAALVTVAVMYVLVAALSTRAVVPGELAASPAPLTLVVGRGAPWFPADAFHVIALFAVANTALLNFVTASRLAFGMSRQRLLPGALRAVHPRYHTPHRAIAAVLAVVTALALLGGLVVLAGATSLILLSVFFAMNVAALAIKRREGRVPGIVAVPRVVPVLGALLSLGLMAFAPPESFAVAGAVLAVGLAAAAIRARAVRGR